MEQRERTTYRPFERVKEIFNKEGLSHPQLEGSHPRRKRRSNKQMQSDTAPHMNQRQQAVPPEVPQNFKVPHGMPMENVTSYKKTAVDALIYGTITSALFGITSFVILKLTMPKMPEVAGKSELE